MLSPVLRLSELVGDDVIVNENFVDILSHLDNILSIIMYDHIRDVFAIVGMLGCFISHRQ